MTLQVAVSVDVDELVGVVFRDAQVHQAPAQRSGKDLLKSLRVRHQLDRNMEGMREDMKKMFGQDVDDVRLTAAFASSLRG